MGRAKPIMIQGTMSNAGKSLLAAALCEIKPAVAQKPGNIVYRSAVFLVAEGFAGVRAVKGVPCGYESRRLFYPEIGE